MVSFAGDKDAQPKRNRAATAINARTASTVTVEPSIHTNGGLGLKKAAIATFCFAACLNTIGRSEIEVVLRRDRHATGHVGFDFLRLKDRRAADSPRRQATPSCETGAKGSQWPNCRTSSTAIPHYRALK
jgi:hypothetical protein